MLLTSNEIVLILDKIHPHHGYSDDPEICNLQIKLSMMLELARRKEMINQSIQPTEENGG